MYEKIKRFVELNLWTEQMVTNVYNKGTITKEEYQNLLKLFK